VAQITKTKHFSPRVFTISTAILFSGIICFGGSTALADKKPIYKQNINDIQAGRDITIIQSQNRNPDKLGTPLTKNEKPFIGALDSEYKKKDNSYITATANFNQESITFTAGNCHFSCATKQNGDSWDLYLVQTDGLCAFLRELNVGERIMRIIPEPGAMANSGRVVRFLAQSGVFPLNEFHGTYTTDDEIKQFRNMLKLNK
jgi:hypothetical protein